MELKDIQQLLDDGYSLVLPKKKKLEDCINYKKVDIKIDDIKEIVINNSDKYNEKFEVDENTALLIKTFARYDLSINDVIKRLELEISKKEKFNFDSLLKWSFDLSNGFFNPAITDEFLSDYSDVYDYLFESNEHLLKYCIRKLRFIKEENALEETQNLLIIINDIWSNRLISKKDRKYNDKTISSLIYEQSAALDNENFAYSYEFNEFYRDNVLRLAELGDGSSMRLLGYNYYEGTFGFEVDSGKSLFWLEKAYEKTKDPDIARTIGYIYYYGRTTNGVPHKNVYCI